MKSVSVKQSVLVTLMFTSIKKTDNVGGTNVNSRKPVDINS